MPDKSQKLSKRIKDYFPLGLTAFLVLASAIVFFFLMFKVSIVANFLRKFFTILQPIIFGLIIAYLLCPIARRIENCIASLENSLHKKRKKNKQYKSYARPVSVILSIIIAMALLYILGVMIIPQIVESVTKLATDMPRHAQKVLKWSDEFLKNNTDFANVAQEVILRANDYFESWLQDSMLLRLNSMFLQFVQSIKNVLEVLLNIIIGIIVSIYVLNSREAFLGQSKKMIYSAFNKRNASLIIKTTQRAHMIFGKFIMGKIVDSLIIGFICYIVLAILNMPYALLISVLVGVTNIIPFFGPFIGAIPSAFLILLVDPIKCLYFVIFIIILQQIDGNIIGPKILGDSTGLSPFWIVTAILLSGGLFGFVGMLIGVPLFAVIYYIIKSLTEYRLSLKKLPTETAVYIHSDGVPKETAIEEKANQLAKDSDSEGDS